MDRVDLLIWEEARSIVAVNNSRSRENTLFLGAWEDGNLLVGPGEEILTSSMSPVLFTGYVGCRVVFAVSVCNILSVPE